MPMTSLGTGYNPTWPASLPAERGLRNSDALGLQLAELAEADHFARMAEFLSLLGRCNIGEMARKVSVKCAIAGCHFQRKMTLAEREELRRVGREKNATAGLVCPAHVKAAFNFEFDDIDIDVPLGELLVERPRKLPVGA